MEQKNLATSISSVAAEGPGEGGDSHTLQVFQTHRAEGKKDVSTVYRDAGNYMPEGGMRGGGGQAGEGLNTEEQRNLLRCCFPEILFEK